MDLAIFNRVLFLYYGILNLTFGYEDVNQKPIRNRDIWSARIESCYGCKVDRLPEVKRFLLNDLPFFHNVKLKEVHGANPDLLLLNKDGQIMERIDLKPLTQKECNMLLLKKGFYKKDSVVEEVPEEYLTGPYGERKNPKFQIDIDDDQDIYVSQASEIRQKDEL